MHLWSFLLGLAALGVSNATASKFFYIGSQKPPDDAFIIFSNFNLEQSGCIRGESTTSAVAGESCCTIRPQNLNSFTALDLSKYCNFPPLSILMKSAAGWHEVRVLGVMEKDSLDARVQSGGNAFAPIDPSNARFQLAKSASMQCSPKDVDNDIIGTGPSAEVWVTEFDNLNGGDNSEWTPTMLVPEGGGASPNLVVNRATKYQEILGWGFALTQATGFVLKETKEQAPDQYWNIMRAMFNPESGLGVSIIRIAVGPCDFSYEGPYSFYDGTRDDDFSRTDKALPAMSIPATDLKYVLPILQDAKTVGGDFGLYFEAWSFPWWMTTPGPVYKEGAFWGDFKDNMADTAASYMVNVAKLWSARGFRIWGVGMINEPSMSGPNQGGWVGLNFNSNQAAAVATAIKKKLPDVGLGGAKIIGYAHNLNHADSYVRPMMDKAGDFIDAISWHCYEAPNDRQHGDIAKMDGFTNKGQFMGECSGFGSPTKKDYFDSDNGLRRMYLLPLSHGAGGVVEWNGVLEASISKLNYRRIGCDTCRGMISSLQSEGYQSACVMPEYFAMRHYSPFLPPGSRRVEMTISNGCIQGHAFEDPSIDMLIVVIHNTCDSKENVVLDTKKGIYKMQLAKGSASFRFKYASKKVKDIRAHFGGATNDKICEISNFSRDCQGDWCGAKLKSRAGHKADKTGSTGLCIDSGGSLAYYCFGENDNQKFDIFPEGQGNMRISHNGQCLSVRDKRSGGAVEFRTCNTNDNGQIWYFGADPANGSPYVLHPSEDKSLCLDLESDGVLLHLWSCHGGPSQQFDLLKKNYEYWANDPIGKKTGCSPNGCWVYFKDHVSWPSALVIDHRGGNTNGEDNWLQGYHGALENENQHWDIVPHPEFEGYYHIAKGGKWGEDYRHCAALDHGQTGENTRMVLQSCNLWKETQIWSFDEGAGDESVDQIKQMIIKDINKKTWRGNKLHLRTKATPEKCIAIDHKFWKPDDWDSGIFSAANFNCAKSDNMKFEILDRNDAATYPAKCGDRADDQCNVLIKDRADYPGGLCLDVLNGNHNNGDWVSGYHCFSENTNQRWNIIHDAKDPSDPNDDSDKVNYVHIQHYYYPDYCLGLWGGDEHHKGNDWGADGSQMVLTRCNLFSEAQKFIFESKGTNDYELKVKASKKCLDVDHNYDNNAKMFKLQQWNCEGSKNQRWGIYHGDDANDDVGPCQSPQCDVVLYSDDFNELSVCIDLPDPNKVATIASCKSPPHKAQMFSMTDDGDGFMHIKHIDSGLCLQYGIDGDGSVGARKCNMHTQDQKFHRTPLQDWNESFGYNMGHFKTKEDGQCLTTMIVDGGKRLKLSSCRRGTSEQLNQNFMVLKKDKIMRVGDSEPKDAIVLEPWITPGMFLDAEKDAKGIIDHYTFCERAPNAADVMKKHVDTFYSEIDFELLHYAGINHLRMPIGFWDLIDLEDDEKAFGRCGNYKYAIKNMCSRARKRNMKIHFDLHGAPGGQNPNDHSGRYRKDGKSFLFLDPRQMDRAMQAIGILADLALSDDCRGVVTAIGVGNEPAMSYDNWYEDLKLHHYWRRAYDKVRYPPSLNGGESNLWVVLNAPVGKNGQTFKSRATERFTSKGGFYLVMIDNHYYHMFGDDSMQNRDLKTQLNPELCDAKKEISGIHGSKRLVVGEWSGAVNDCDAPFLVTAWHAFPDRTTQSTKCDQYHWWTNDSGGWPNDNGPTNDNHELYLKSFIRNQLDAYNSGAGSFFWTARTERRPYTSHQWDFTWLVANNFFDQSAKPHPEEPLGC
ncbi:hypothetical protein HDU97_004886 [Phlyctochytrium planicorne]|nr:hypothetical protein HDU97_004886 [Phlyctochytrium planicorne]